tara:strand:- start:2142 stop:2600 length:459 start_codon:yes stop_codon:yes gene_type:complete
MNIKLLHQIAQENTDFADFKHILADKIGLDPTNETDMSRLEDYMFVDSEYNQLQFVLRQNGTYEFEEDFNYRTDIVERSELVFETPILKPNISAFATGKKRNITMSFIFKLCVVLNCSPNDLYDWGLWREKVMKLMDNENRKITNDDIKNLL